MAEQLSLDLPVRIATGREAFLVAPPNALAVAAIDDWLNWPAGRLALCGLEGAGKSHLAAVWCEEAGGVLCPSHALPPPAESEGARIGIEDAEQIAGDAEAEEQLLHLLNVLGASDGRVLLIARDPPARWPISLPDLASRLRAVTVARIDAPDDALLSALLVKLFEDRQLAVTPDFIRWCVPRMERSFAAAQRLVALLDSRGLAEGRPIGRKLAAEVLDNMEGNGH